MMTAEMVAKLQEQFVKLLADAQDPRQRTPTSRDIVDDMLVVAIPAMAVSLAQIAHELGEWNAEPSFSEPDEYKAPKLERLR